MLNSRRSVTGGGDPTAGLRPAGDGSRRHSPAQWPNREPWSGFDEVHGAAPSFFSNAWEDIGIEVEERFFAEVPPNSDVLGEHVVGDVMTRGLFALPPDTPLDLAGMYMMRRGIHRVLVMDGMQLLGIASASDFVRAIAEHRI